MHYVSLIPHETVELQTARSRLTFALFMLLLCIPCSLLVVYFSRMHVRPIKELQVLVMIRIQMMGSPLFEGNRNLKRTKFGFAFPS